MPLFLVTSVCDEGMSPSRFRVMEAESRLVIAGDMLADPATWDWALRETELWWDLTSYPAKYGRPRGWTTEELLERIDRTWVDGDSRYQVRIHAIETIEPVPSRRPGTARRGDPIAAPHGPAVSGKE
jgi:hypothetical protein